MINSKYAMLVEEYEDQSIDASENADSLTLEEYAQSLIHAVESDNVQADVDTWYDIDTDGIPFMVVTRSFDGFVAEIQLALEENDNALVATKLSGFEIKKDGDTIAIADNDELVSEELTPETVNMLLSLFVNEAPTDVETLNNLIGEKEDTSEEDAAESRGDELRDNV